jgi:hypothetical protein
MVNVLKLCGETQLFWVLGSRKLQKQVSSLQFPETNMRYFGKLKTTWLLIPSIVSGLVHSKYEINGPTKFTLHPRRVDATGPSKGATSEGDQPPA